MIKRNIKGSHRITAHYTYRTNTNYSKLFYDTMQYRIKLNEIFKAMKETDLKLLHRKLSFQIECKIKTSFYINRSWKNSSQ